MASSPNPPSPSSLRAPPALPPGVSVRRRALFALLAVEEGALGSQVAVREALVAPPELAGPDRGLVTELVYATLRHQRVLDRWIATACSHGLSGLDIAVLVALRVGACQLAYLPRVPAFAAVDATVEAAKGLAGLRAIGFVHAVLRSLARQRPVGGAGPDGVPPAASLPDSACAGSIMVPASNRASISRPKKERGFNMALKMQLGDKFALSLTS